MKLLLIIGLILVAITSSGQSMYDSIKKQKLLPTKIDTSTEKIFVYIKRDARIYFRDSDILQALDKMSETGSSELFQTLRDTLNSEKQKIEIMDVKFTYDDQEGANLISDRKISNRALTVNEQFEPLGSDMLLQGKFMIYSVKRHKVVNTRLKAVSTTGVYGTKYLSFIFPDRTVFFLVRTSSGE
jgi:hypothetical protein